MNLAAVQEKLASLGVVVVPVHKTTADYQELANDQKAHALKAKKKKKIFSPRSQCTGKMQHNSPEAARLTMKKASKIGLTVYHCKHCGKYHIGKAR